MAKSGWGGVSIIFVSAMLACGGGGSSRESGSSNPPPPATQTGYALLAWSELGMHCMDGKDYSVMSILPPYNTVHAQLVKRSEPPQVITSGVTLTYEAIADTNASSNTKSSVKTNFWAYVKSLFLASPTADVGLAGNAVQSATPHALSYNSTQGWWEAVGIPTVPYDDAGLRNAYPMARLVARDAQGNQLAEARIVLAVSDEISCGSCHGSNSNPAAKPASGWENDPDPNKDAKLNILKRHDDSHDVSGVLTALAAKGYTYQASLYQTAKSGTPVLCASCHATNALGTTGVSGVNPVTEAMHSAHGGVINPATGVSLDSASTPFGSCYLCHPGVQTKCQRGAMSGVACFDCHGNLTAVGTPGRRGWLDEPSCEMCHNNSTRFGTTFASTGVWRTTNDVTFSTTANVPVAGARLFRFSTGHGTVHCGGCHGAPHAEFPTSQPNDNVYATNLQAYEGTIIECGVCHTSTPSGGSGGPHNLHAVGQSWVSAHHQYAQNGASQCAYCHGLNFRGTFLSQTETTRTFDIEHGSKTFPARTAIGCYDCHNGPNGG
jgi:hypothetical protein